MIRLAANTSNSIPLIPLVYGADYFSGLGKMPAATVVVLALARTKWKFNLFLCLPRSQGKYNS